jgi:putative ABC transport system permease protein
MMLISIKQTVVLGIKSLWLHRLRSVLATLGVILGVSSVIAMLAIGEGASQHAQEQIDRLGSRNIIIKTIKPIEDREAGSSRGVPRYGITYDDAECFGHRIPNVKIVVPIRRLSEYALYLHDKMAVEVVGTTPKFRQLSPTIMQAGRFINPMDLLYKQGICVIDDSIIKQLFVLENPMGKDIKIGRNFYKVVGIIKGTTFESVDFMEGNRGSANADQGGANMGRIYIPLSTAQERFGDISSAGITINGLSGEFVELHEIVVNLVDIEDVLPTRAILENLLRESHKKADYEIIVPLELLKEAERTKFIFSAVLGSIAAISLVVGGIGIMNIMLATISERTREIGIRRALGARKQDIITQFLSETLLLTLTGGLLGICLGCVIPVIVTRSGKMPTVITGESLVLAFGISVTAGILFGLYPACRAAGMDPIESLRHE